MNGQIEQRETLRTRGDSTARGSAFRGVLASVAVVLALAPSVVQAQAVSGRVLEAGTQRPLRTAFVVLIDESGERVRGGLTGADGGFVIEAPAGTYRVQAELIGYENTTSDPIELSEGSVTPLTLEVPLNVVRLEGIDVSSERRCEEGGAHVAALWEEARKALAVTAWGEEWGDLRFRLRKYERRLEPGSLEVRDEQTEVGGGVYEASPYESLPPRDLTRRGYARGTRYGGYDFYAPDAEVILSEEFLDSHCFSLRAPPDDDGSLVGLAFQPLEDEDVVDVEGVLWVDATSGELRSLDFEYTELPWDVSDEDVGGRVEFSRLANGLWIVDRWWIRMPMVQDGPRPRTVALREEGAEVLEVSTSTGETLAAAAAGSVFGTVFDSTSMGPLEGAHVELAGTDYTTRTGPGGAFRLSAVPEGTYRVRASHPDLDFLGLVLADQTVTVRSGESESVRLVTPPAASVVTDVCGSRDLSLLLGVVRSENGEPVGGARVGAKSAGGAGVEATADWEGAFHACVPEGERVRVLAWPPPTPPWDVGSPLDLLAGEEQDLGVTVFGVESIRRMEMTVSTPGRLEEGDLRLGVEVKQVDIEDEDRGDRPAIIQGMVVGTLNAEPVSQALLTLRNRAGEEVASTESDSNGRFQLLPPGAGDYELEVLRLGYEAASVPVEFGGSSDLALQVGVEVVPVELEGVTAEGIRVLDLRGFLDRRARGRGHFIDEIEITRRSPPHLAGILRGSMEVEVRDGEVFFTGNQSPRALRCYPAIWLDGIKLRDGGDTAPVGRGFSNRVGPNVRLNDVAPPQQIAGVEIYRRASEVPPQFGGGDAGCGVIVVWTRRGPPR